MRICVIRPAVLHKEVALSHMPSAPLGLAYIAAVLKRAGHAVQVIDAAIEGFNDVEPFIMDTYIYGLNAENTVRMIEEVTDMVCLSLAFTNNWYFDREVAKEARKRFPGAVIVGGGEHATAVPEYCLDTSPSLDYIVMGEGEMTLLELIEGIEGRIPKEEIDRIAYRRADGSLAVNNGGQSVKRMKDVDSLPWPAWELFPLDKYFGHKVSYGVYRGNSLPIMASRGCPYECTFCSNPVMWGRLYKLRSVTDFVDEMEHWHRKYGVVNFDFYDLTAVVRKDWIMEMCDELMRRELDITYQIPAGTRAEAIDLKVADRLFRSGCKNITYAPESGSAAVLRDIKKKVKLRSIYDSIRHSHKVGMNIKLNIIAGFPDETHRDIWLTVWFLIRSSWYGAHDMYPAVFSPYPGSALYDRLAAEGKVSIYDDGYIAEIINSHDLWPGKTYNDRMAPAFIKTYTIVMYIAFYGSNFLFRPIRLFRIIRNLMSMKFESRSELVIHQTLTKLLLAKKYAVHEEADLVHSERQD